MSTRTVVTEDGTEYKFENWSWTKSHSWGHETHLYINGGFAGKNRCRYINRTREAYQYQSCMRSLIYNLQDGTIADYIAERKVKEGIKRLSKVLREQWTEGFKRDNPNPDEVLDKLNF